METALAPKGVDEDEPQFELEGGSDGSSSDSDLMAPSEKEFIEDLDSKQARLQKRTRIVIYFCLALIYATILGIYSAEGIHSRGG